MALPSSPALTRRRLLLGALVATAAVACGGRGDGPSTGGDATAPRTEEEVADHDQGRLAARPGRPSFAPPPPGEHPLDLGHDRQGILRVPAGHRAEEPAPLVVSLHGAGGTARQGIDLLAGLADEHGLVLVAPASRDPRSWDLVVGEVGPDVAALDAALTHVFDRVAVDPGLVAVAGFSDGASYAASIGLANGDLFGHVMAFSPGFASPPRQEGRPRVFVSHGTGDDVLPIDATSRTIVPRLRQQGYEVEYREFQGGHVVPPGVAADAVGWFLAAP